MGKASCLEVVCGNGQGRDVEGECFFERSLGSRRLRCSIYSNRGIVVILVKDVARLVARHLLSIGKKDGLRAAHVA